MVHSVFKSHTSCNDPRHCGLGFKLPKHGARRFYTLTLDDMIWRHCNIPTLDLTFVLHLAFLQLWKVVTVSLGSRSSNLQLEGTIPVCNSDAPNLNYISYHIQIVYTNIITIARTIDLYIYIYIDHDTCENDRTCCPQTKPPKVFRHFLAGDLSKRSSDDFIIGSQGSQFLPACLSRIPGGWRVVKALDIDA